MTEYTPWNRRAVFVTAWLGVIAAVGAFGTASAQAVERVTFEEAIRRATTSHPTVQRAAADILRAQAVLDQVRSRALPTLDATLTTNIIHPVTKFEDTAITPRTQTLTAAGLAVPLYVPVA